MASTHESLNVLPAHHSFDIPSFENASFLITGGAGFIGSHIAERLLKNGAKKVRVLDNFATGYRANIEILEAHPNFELLEGDIRSTETCQAACQGIDYVSHQAALNSVPRSIHNPLATVEANVIGHLNVLLAARDQGVKRTVYAASSSVYGDLKDLPKVEGRVGEPLSPYAASKRANELLAGSLGRVYDLEAIGLRYFNVFGPRQNPKGGYAAVIPRFITAIIEGRTPTVYGDGEQTRDFTFIDNVVQANLRAMFSTHPEAANQVYNIAVGGRISLNSILAQLKAASGKEFEVNYQEERPGDVRDSLADISKAQRLLGYEPQVDFERGIVTTYEWFAANTEYLAKLEPSA